MQHRRPNGEWTADPALAFGEWEELAKPFKELGFAVIGYDPGLLMFDPQSPNSTFNMPTHVAQRIADALTAN